MVAESGAGLSTSSGMFHSIDIIATRFIHSNNSLRNSYNTRCGPFVALSVPRTVGSYLNAFSTICHLPANYIYGRLNGIYKPLRGNTEFLSTSSQLSLLDHETAKNRYIILNAFTHRHGIQRRDRTQTRSFSRQ